MQNSNYQKFDSAFMLIAAGDLMSANSLVLNVADTNDIEYNLKTVLKIYLHSLLFDSVISAVDSSLLLEIAYRNPITGGNGVFMARTILNLEVNDEPLSSSSRYMQPRNSPKEITINIYPNPSNNIVNVLLSNSSNAEEIQLSDLTGRVCSKVTFSNQMSTSRFLPGVYFLRIKYGNYTWNERLIINR